MELLLAYIAGLLTLVNPCVLPVLPIVLAASLQADRRGPLALAAGLIPRCGDRDPYRRFTKAFG